MNRRRFLLAFSILTLFVPVNMAVPQKSDDEVFVSQGFVKTEDYLGYGQHERALYAEGLVDGISLSPLFDASGGKNEDFVTIKNCVRGMTNTQVEAIITKYAKEHPEKWHIGANFVAYLALREACAATNKLP